MSDLTPERLAEIRAFLLARMKADHPHSLTTASLAAIDLIAAYDAQAALIADLKRRLAEATEWRPIETAPADDVLLHAWDDHTQRHYFWVGRPDVEHTSDGGLYVIEPTGWLPLPAVKESA